jgi:hypothetical protein
MVPGDFVETAVIFSNTHARLHAASLNTFSAIQPSADEGVMPHQ